MQQKGRRTELHYLENYRLVFTNLSEVANIQEEIAEYGYDDTVINQGKVLYETAKALYEKRQEESAQEKETYDIFAQALEEFSAQYRKDRRKAKVALMNHTQYYELFHLKKQVPQAYLKLIQEAKFFYEQIKNNTETKQLLTRLKLTDELADSQLAQLETVTQHRAKYEKEKGESQQATKDKNQAFEAISEWMREFYAVAEIALEDHPQYLESIGKFIKS